MSLMRVLVVDDDTLDRQAARRALAATGMVSEIADAESGEAALEMLATSEFDAVLLDFHLPDSDGLELLRRLDGRALRVPVIVLTGYGDDLVAAELINAGAADYLSKARLSPDLLALSLRHIQHVRAVRAEAARAEAEREQTLLNLAAEQSRTEAILTSMTDGLVVCDLAGNVLTMNPEALAIHGFQDVEEARRPLPQYPNLFEVCSLDGRKLALSEWPIARALNGEKFSHYEILVRRLDTGRTWIGSYGGTPVRSKTGEVILAISTVRDITEAKQAARRTALLAEAGARLSASLDAQTTLETAVQLVVPDLADWCAVHALGPDGLVRSLITRQTDSSFESSVGTKSQLHEPQPQTAASAAPLNSEAAYGIGYVLRTGTAQLIPRLTDEVMHRPAQDEALWASLLALGAASYLCVPLIARRQVLGSLSLALLDNRRVYNEQDLMLALELGQRMAAGLENVRLFNEAQARAEREAMINKIGSALRISLDGDEILKIVTEQIGLALGVSRCRFLRLSASRDTLESASQQYTDDAVSKAGIAPKAGIVPETGAAALTDWPAAVIDQWAAGHPAVVSGADAAWISCPVFLRGQFGGVLLAEQMDRPRVWSQEETLFLCAITDILALALENARLYAREHRVADMLSSAFLTDIPDELPGLALAANYRAGLEEAQVGGDYYDAFILPDGRVALVIADVSGKGLSAAVQTATVKYSLRAFATEAGAPGLVMTRLNKMLCSDLAGLGEHFVTLFYSVFEPATGRLAWASAGHEVVLIKRFAGGSQLLEANGPILGLADHAYSQETDTLAPGDSLVLYTDGLTEARDPEKRALLDIAGVCALVEAVPAEAWPGALAAHLQQAAMRWTGGRPQDDMALLVARRRQPAPLPETATEPPLPLSKITWNDSDDDLFDFHFPSRADYVVEVRQALGHWMATLGYNRAATEDFQTAVTEAVTNAVRHGSPTGEMGVFHVLGRRTSVGALHVEVTDSGVGLPPSQPLPLMPEPEALGGRGLPLMQELADTVEFRPVPNGLCVVLVKHCPE
jgi:serine phosphatase RsbU (regulator of sigma subunit)/DNA-binding NarL/FixJ family response regulator/anti-sigma regulatory factor (Ser/Thr protein kinase)